VDSDRSFGELLDLSRRVAHPFDARERQPWTVEVLLIELVKLEPDRRSD
jgi:hypothetical protein